MRWYRYQALTILPKRTINIASQCHWIKNIPIIKVRKMKRQWGNCARCGQLTFNTHLIKAPLELIDYVILHELCHLQEFNHSIKFYALMSSIDPEWRTKKNMLDKITSLLLTT